MLISDVAGAAHFVASVNQAGQAAGLSAGELVKQFAPVLGARGGGKADLAQGAGGDPARIDEAIGVVALDRGAAVTVRYRWPAVSRRRPGRSGSGSAWTSARSGSGWPAATRAGVLAVPVETVPADPRTGRDLDRIAALVAEHEAVGVVLGLPRTLAGRDGPAVRAARSFGAALRERIDPVTVRYVDERMTTVLAQRNLTASGVRGRAKRAVVDQAAAVQILQSFLDGAGTIPAPRSDGGTNR